MHTNHDKLQLHFPHIWYRFSSAEADSCLCWGLRCLTLPWSLMCHGANADQLRAGQPSFPTQLLVKLKRILFFVFSCSKEKCAWEKHDFRRTWQHDHQGGCVACRSHQLTLSACSGASHFRCWVSGSEGGRGTEMSTSSAWFGDGETIKNKAKAVFIKGRMHWETGWSVGLLLLSF